MRQQRTVMDDLGQLLAVLPPHIRERAEALADLDQLIEIVLDLGRQPEARLPQRFVYLNEAFVTQEDLEYVVNRVGEFGEDNRAGIERTLHRISAIRNRRGRIVGLTLRVGRAVFGTLDIVRDVIETRRSILLLGRPGVGKTTMLREMARVLADDFKRRVVIVDTSNEIAGDGDVPHPGIGHARRMQVPTNKSQAAVMIEAVENHMPEVIVIDEIGTEAEAQAARTIAERGVQLVGTAHGITLENLVLNPTLSDLVGGIQAVTLGDEEARRRGTQKTVLERKAPPTFDIVIEIQEKDRLAIHHDVARTVDLLLRGIPPRPEVRVRDSEGRVQVVQKAELPEAWDEEPPVAAARPPEAWGEPPGRRRHRQPGVVARGLETPLAPAGAGPRAGGAWARDGEREGRGRAGAPAGGRARLVRLFPYGVSVGPLERALREQGVGHIVLTKHLPEADMIVTTKSQYRKMPKRLKEAAAGGLPIHVMRNNTQAQITTFVNALADQAPPGAWAESGEADAPYDARLEAPAPDGRDGGRRTGPRPWRWQGASDLEAGTEGPGGGPDAGE